MDAPDRLPDGHHVFADVQGRPTVDIFLRNAQQELVALNSQADFKASVIITASAVVSSIAAVQIGDEPLGVAAGVLVGFLLLALLASVLAVFPKYRVHVGADAPLPEHWNPLYFGDYARISKERYLAELAPVLRADETVYEVLVADLYVKGVQLEQGKYRYLRVSYACFLAAFAVAAITFVIASAID